MIVLYVNSMFILQKLNLMNNICSKTKSFSQQYWHGLCALVFYTFFVNNREIL